MLCCYLFAVQNLLEAPSESLALLNVSKLNIDFSKGKKDSSIDCNVALSGFTVLDQVPTDQDNGFSTNKYALAYNCSSKCNLFGIKSFV